jgi:hypothetical protein
VISRSTSKLLAEIYASVFDLKRRSQPTWAGVKSYYEIDNDMLYDFLYERNYQTWFLNVIERSRFRSPRTLEEFIMKINTGESLVAGTTAWTFPQREKLGQRYLQDLAEDMIEYREVKKGTSSTQDDINKLKSKLELDGYIWNSASKKLLYSEDAVLDVKEEQGILTSLVNALSLDNSDTILHHLALSAEHYINEKWDDSISQSRKFLESILQEVAARHHIALHNRPLSRGTYDQASSVRDYLETAKLIEGKEKEAISKIYGLLSDTGGHPYIAEKDQARLMRHLALTFSQFIMLRLSGYLNQKK